MYENVSAELAWDEPVPSGKSVSGGLSPDSLRFPSVSCNIKTAWVLAPHKGPGTRARLLGARLACEAKSPGISETWEGRAVSEVG